MAQITRLINAPQPSAKQTFHQKGYSSRPRADFPAFASFSIPEPPAEVKFETTTNVPDASYFKVADSQVNNNFKDFPKTTECQVVNKSFYDDYTKALNNKAAAKNKSIKCEPIPLSLVEALQQVTNNAPLPSQPAGPLSDNVRVGLDQVLATLDKYFPPKPAAPACDTTKVTTIQDIVKQYLKPKPARPVRSTPISTISDIVNDLAVANWKRIFAAAPISDPVQLEALAQEILGERRCNDKISDTMAGRLPVLTTSDLPAASAQEASATASPARGTAMLNSIFKSVRVPEFRFKWQFWAEKGQQSTPGGKSATAGAEEYAARPKPLGDQIISVKEFYQHFNNIPVSDLKLRDSIHLFHLGVKPLWEDPRNTRGGAYYFRVSKELAPDFWHEICLLAVGDILQGAVETKRQGKSLPFTV